MNDTDFYRNRSLALKKVRAWGKAYGFGPASRVVAEILARMTTTEPWAWVRMTSVEDWAESWGYSVRTLHRHLTLLHDLGVLTSGVRSSEAIRKRGEYPVYVIEPWAISHLLEWHPEGPNGPFPGRREGADLADSGSAESALLAHSERQSGRFSTEQADRDKHPETQVAQGFAASSRAGGEPVEKKRMREVTVRDSRRLRRRSQNKKQERDMPIRLLNGTPGADPDRSSEDEPKGAATPAGRLAKVFEKEWDAVRVQSTRPLPAKPWSIGGKSRFYGWVNTTLIPVCGSEELARTLIVEFCRQVRSGGVQLPRNERPIFDTLGTQLDKMLAKARQPSAQERMAAIEARQRESLEAERKLIEENNRRLGLASG